MSHYVNYSKTGCWFYEHDANHLLSNAVSGPVHLWSIFFPHQKNKKKLFCFKWLMLICNGFIAGIMHDLLLIPILYVPSCTWYEKMENSISDFAFLWDAPPVCAIKFVLWYTAYVFNHFKILSQFHHIGNSNMQGKDIFFSRLQINSAVTILQTA